jgi:hypothetical protein
MLCSHIEQLKRPVLALNEETGTICGPSMISVTIEWFQVVD